MYSELEHYRTIVSKLIELAEKKFIYNQHKGKKGWATMSLVDLDIRISEEWHEYYMSQNEYELGDVFNYLVFALASKENGVL